MYYKLTLLCIVLFWAEELFKMKHFWSSFGQRSNEEGILPELMLEKVVYTPKMAAANSKQATIPF